MDYITLVCCILAFVLYLNTLNSGFVYDDRRAILSNVDVVGNTAWKNAFIHDFWGTPLTDSGSHGSYRPLCVLSFRLNFLLGGHTAWGFHLINNMLHCFATGLVVKLARQLLSSVWGIIVTGALFAVHPIHTEAVAGIVGRADLATCACYLLAFISYIRHIMWRMENDQRQWLALMFTIMASVASLLFKETGITALLACGIFDMICSACGCKDKWRRRSLCVIMSAFLCAIYVRLVLIPQPKATFSSADNPIAKINSIWIRLLTFVYLPVFNFKLLINPNILSFDWGMDAIPRIATIFDRRNLLSIIFYSTLVYVIWRCYQLLFATCNPTLTNRKSNRKVNTNLTNDAGYQTQRQIQHKSRTQRKYAYTHCKSTSSLYLINCSNSSNHPGSYWKQNYFDNKEDKTYTNYSCRLTTSSNINQQTNNNNNHNNNSHNNNNHNNHNNHNNNNNNNNSILNLNFKKSYQKECYQSHQCQLMSSSTAEGLPQTLSLALQKVIAPVITSRSSRSSSSCSSSTTASSKSSTSSTSSTFSSDSLKSYLWKPNSIASYRGCWLTNDDYLLSHIHPQHIDACVLGMSLVFLTLPFLPATNLFFYIGFVVAERLLYLPSVGFCLLVGFGISKLIDYLQAAGKCRSKQILISIMCISLCILSLRTILRNSDWKNEENLYRSAIVINPPKALGNLGSVLSSQGRYKEAEIILIKAIEMRPNMADAHFNLGILYQNQQKFKLAVLSFKSAIKFRPNLAAAYLNLGITLIALGKYQEAVQILQDGCNTDGTGVRDRISHENARISSYLQLGTLYTEQGKLHRALAVYREALHELPHNYHMRDVLHNRLGDLFSRLQQWDASERHHRLALNLQPNHASTYFSYGITLARNHNRTAEAESWFKRAILLAPNQASAHHHYGEFLTSQYRHAEAVVHKVKAAELAPNDYTLMVAAANALRRVNRKAEAELWYRKAMNLLPNDGLDGHNSNLDAILQLLGQTNKADATYKDTQILQTKDRATLNNLAKLGLTHA